MMHYDYDDQNIFAKILRGEIPNEHRGRDRAHAGLQRHPRHRPRCMCW